MKSVMLSVLLATIMSVSLAQKTNYPYPLAWLPLTFENQSVRMAYMDVKPAKPNGETVLLLHGKNFEPEKFRTEVLRFLNWN